MGGGRSKVSKAVLLPAALLVVATAASAEDDQRRMSTQQGDDDSRLSEGQLGLDDLLGAGDREEDTEERVQTHLEAARNYLDVEAYDSAMEELEAADRLVPFHEDVVSLMELAGEMRDTARQHGMALSEIEEERRAREARRAMERQEAERKARAVDEVIDRRGLPGALNNALVALLDRRSRLDERRAEARLSRERCIGAAARANAHGAGRHCRREESVMTEIRREEREMDADLAVLTAAFRERHGQQALDRLLDEAEGQ